MSNRRQANGPDQNGQKYIDSIDPDDPEYVKELLRPVEVKQDVKQMEERKRVNLILKSKAFRQELEQIVVEQLKSGPTPASVLALQQISEMFLPQARLKHGAIFGKGNGPVIPICNISSEEAAASYERGEKLIRCKLASSYRVSDLLGWSHGTAGYITARINPDTDALLVAPHGLAFGEMTASSLVRISGDGAVIYQGSTNFPLDLTALHLHLAIHSIRPDLRSVINIRCPPATSVSSMACGLLPLCHDAMVLGHVSSFDYSGGELDNEQQERLQDALGSNSKVLLVPNRGFFIGGESIEECFQLSRNLMNAIDTQLRALPLGLDNLYLPSEEAQRKAFELASRPPSGDRKWKRGEMEFEAMMRHLDNAGYCTGYLFREPLLRKVEKHDRVNAEVEVPPTSTSFVYNENEKDRLLKKPLKAEWLNSPNAYKKEETEETTAGGTAPQSRKVTRWIPDEAPGTIIKIENPNQFVPVGTNPKEVKAKVKEIRKEYYDEKITAGPQSRILEGMTWEEAQKIREGNVASDTIILVGAASRGIIQRDHQSSATVFKTYYAPNPFDNVTEEDVEEYKAEVQKKTKRTTSTGEALTTEDESDAIVPGPDGRLISTDERMHQIRVGQTESPLPQQTQSSPVHVSRPALETAVDAFGGGEPQPAPIVRAQPPPKPERAVLTDAAPALSSPAKSTSSGEATAEERSGAESSPVKESQKKQPESSTTPTPASEEKEKKKKKKGGFRMPSFSSKKKEK